MPNIVIRQDIIEKKIYLIRRQRVMLDSDLAQLYGVETKVLNQAVKRNYERFPEDFMFQLTKRILEVPKCHFKFKVTNCGLRCHPDALHSRLKLKELQKKYSLSRELGLFYNILGIIKLRKKFY